MLMSALQRGFTLIEILVSLIILLIGLLGLAGLIARTNQAEMEAYQRVQAILLMQDMLDRVNANRQVASCYSNGASGITAGTGVSAIAACGTGTTAQQAVANADLAAWDAMLKGSAEQEGGNNIGVMIGARGCITYETATGPDGVAYNIYRVSVAWQGLDKTAAPSIACGQNQYGNEAQRRVVSAALRIGNLS